MKKGTTLRSNIGRIYGEGPIQYQRGWTEFYKLKFKVTPDVLIPRPETEILVDEVIKLKPNTLMDLGTGSGCIAISAAKNLSGIKIITTDLSNQALEIARQNAKFHHVENQIIFLQADLLSFIKPGAKCPEIIAANLPYIPTSHLLLIDPLVADFEPKTALDGGADGFDLYRKLFAQIRDKNYYPKVLMIELNDTHAQFAPQEAKKYFPEAEIELKKDLNKVDRFLVIRFSLSNDKIQN